MEIQLPEPVDRAILRLTVPEPTVGPALTNLQVRTDTGTTTAFPSVGEETTIALPPGETRTVRVTATGFADGSRGTYFEVADIGLTADGQDVPLLRTIALPDRPEGTLAPSGWLLRQELPGRSDCVHGGSPVDGLAGAEEETGAVRCAADLRIDAEEPGRFARLLDVPEPVEVTPQLLVRPRSSEALDDVLRGIPAIRFRQVRAFGESAVTDPAGGPNAAVDGDRATSWHAPDGPSPTLELRLPERQLVGSLRLWAPAPRPPPRRRSSPSTPVCSAPASTCRSWTGRRTAPSRWTCPRPHRPTHSAHRHHRRRPHPDRRSRARRPGRGVGAGPSGARIGALPAANDEPVTLTCQDGPTIHLGDRVVATKISASRRDLLRGAAVMAEPCDSRPLALDAGAQEVSVDPGEAFTVDAVGLVVVGPDGRGDASGGEGGSSGGASTSGPVAPLGGGLQPTRAVGTVAWEASRRELAVPASARERVLVVPESVTPAWQARLVADDGSELADPRSVTVDGWKQGWVLPASDTGMTLVLTVPLDRPYRAALLTGPIALLLVLVLFLMRGRHDRAGARALPRRAGGPVIVAATAAFGYLVAGPVGLGLSVVLTAAALLTSRYLGAGRARRCLVAGAGVGIVAGAALLTRAPWPDALGYAGDGWGPQVATVFGLVCAGLAAGWPSVGAPSVGAVSSSSRSSGPGTDPGADTDPDPGTGRAPGSRRGDNQRRDGSSTSE
ncbi:hypothetical protein ACFSSF_00555 [Dietzia aerolata]|uniref:hypothetical protein n=1 Tax=Dietzia aerolata TaxID=595984 RepID=UPI003635435B